MSDSSLNIPQLDARITLEAEGPQTFLVVRYVVANHLAVPLLVFDRRWSDAMSDFDQDQADIVFDGDRAILRRCYVAPPDGVLSGDDLVPYGRVVDPGASVLTTLRAPLPLREAGAWLRLRRRALASDDTRDVPIHRVTLEVGWSALLDREALPTEARVGIVDRGETLLPIPAELIAAAQQIASSETFYVELGGQRFAGGVME